MPLGWYLVTQSEVNGILYDAQSRLVQSCMESAGFAYDFPSYTADVDFLGKRYGVSPAIAAQIGFQSLDALQGADDDSILESPTDPAYEAALYGNGSNPVESNTGQRYDLGNGCFADGVGNLYGGLQGYADYSSEDFDIQQLGIDAYFEAASSDEVQSALSSWLTCMNAAGYDVTSRDELLAREWEEPRPSESEAATAVTDSECLIAADYRSIHVEQESQAQLAMIEERGLDLEEFQEERSALVAQATDVIAQNP